MNIFKKEILKTLSLVKESDQEKIYDYFITKGKLGEDSMLNNKLLDEIKTDTYKTELKNLLYTADKIANNSIIFNDKWDMEQTQKYYDYPNGINWLKSMNKDDEYVFMLNRHGIWNTMAKAYFITKDEKYVVALISQFNSWTDQDYPKNGMEGKTNRCLDKGIRTLNWIKVIKLIHRSDNFTPAIFSKMLSSIIEQINLMQMDYPDYQKLSNHGTIQNEALVVLKYYFSELEIWDDEETLIEKVEDNARLQILPDGIHWEQSPMYHCWMVKSFLNIKKYFKLQNVELSMEYDEKASLIALAMIKFVQPNLHQPMQNDSDDTNIFDMLTMSSLELDDGRFKYLSDGKFNIDLLLEYGLQGIRKINKIKSIEPEFTSFAGVESGNYFLRSSWDKDANYLSFRNGQYGSGHSHSELNHITVFANGEEWITNTGRYTYINNKDRVLFKDASMHNAVLINGKGATTPENAWGFKNIAKTFNANHVIKSNIDFVSGLNLGYMFGEKPLIPNRKIIFIKPNYWIIFDNFYTKFNNNYSFLFHILNDTKVEQTNDKITLSRKNKKFNIHKLDEIHYGLKNSYISKHYNLKEKAKVLIGDSSKEGNFMFGHVLEVGNNINKVEELKIKKGDGKDVQSSEARAWKVVFKNKDFDIILHALTENMSGKKLYVIEGYSLYAKTCVISSKNGIVTENILEY